MCNITLNREDNLGMRNSLLFQTGREGYELEIKLAARTTKLRLVGFQIIIDLNLLLICMDWRSDLSALPAYSAELLMARIIKYFIRDNKYLIIIINNFIRDLISVFEWINKYLKRGEDGTFLIYTKSKIYAVWYGNH